MLKLWVALVESQPETEGPAVTLFVSGAMISGRIIPARKFFAAAHMEELYDKLRAEDEGQDLSKAMDRRFVHLIDPKIFRGRELPVELDGTVWRGRISEISGFTFGQLSVNTA